MKNYFKQIFSHLHIDNAIYMFNSLFIEKSKKVFSNLEKMNKEISKMEISENLYI